jgi:hypothetical protein
MTASNPLILSHATRFKPLSVRAHSRSPSRSPIHKTEFIAHELDPLLGNLSPESTLQAFSATETPSTNRHLGQDRLRAIIANASTVERALGIKAALAAQKVRQWLTEINRWHWPDPKASTFGAGFVPPAGNEIRGRSAGFHEDLSYMGSLRVDTVRQYEARIEEIKDSLEALDVEDLKEHVLDAHIPSRSRPGTRNGLSEATSSGSEYGRLDDLTAVITATILQTLPYLAELNMLITIWEVRIAVLVEIPGLVQRLNHTRAAVEGALKEVRAENSKSLYTKPYVDSTKERLETEVSSLGVRFDRALDLLEGREDSLPNAWIEEMDTIESHFGEWVVEAERKAANHQWQQHHRQPPSIPNRGETAAHSAHHSSGGLPQPQSRPTNSSNPADHAAQDDEPQSSTKQEPLPEHPALVAFKHRPVRKTSVKHSPAARDGPSTELVSDRTDAVDEDDLEARTMDGAQTTVAGPAEEARELDGVSSQKPPSGGPVMSYSLQQQARLADLISLNQGGSAKGYQHGFGKPDHDDARASKHQKNTEAEQSSFLTQEPGTIQELSKKKPSLKLDLPTTRHRREISEVSIADSAFSEAFSDLSNAEIVDATKTQVLASPKINVVESPFKVSRDNDLTFAGKDKPRVQSMHILGKDAHFAQPAAEGHKRSKSLTLTAVSSHPGAEAASHALHERPVDDREVHEEGLSRPLMLHRASIASFEVIPKGLVRRVDSGRKISYDPNLVSPIDSDGSPADMLKPLSSGGSIRSVSSVGTEQTGTPTPHDRSARDRLAGDSSQPVQSSSDTEAFARSQAGALDTVVSTSPTMPRKPSKRQSQDLDNRISPTSIEPSSTMTVDEAPIFLPSTFSPFETRDHKSSPSANKLPPSEETLEAKIKDILINLPTRIRLTSDSDSSGTPAHQSSSDSTRSSTPAPTLTLSPARQDRSSRRYNAGNSEVKVYHLIRSGQPRDAPPTKLHVRLVGENGERVMVRVGGGWADLAEYLREYSLHHGKRTIQEGRFEVANLPSTGAKASETAGSSPIGPSLGLAKTRSASRPDAGFDFGALPSLNTGKARRSVTAPISTERKDYRPPSPAFGEAPPVRPPPVPVIPTSFREEPLAGNTTSPSTTTTKTTSSLTVTTDLPSHDPSFSTTTFITPSTPLSGYQTQSRNSATTAHPTVTTNSTLSTPVSGTSSPGYTPLGAAGPKGGIKNAKIRAATSGSPAVTNPENEAWVQGMIGKARRVSGQNNPSQMTTVTGPNNTTTTSASTPSSRRVSVAADATFRSTTPNSTRPSVLDPTSTPTTPDGGRGSQTPSPISATRDARGTGSAEKPRSRSVTGIRRVFLRSSKKADKAG